MNCHVCNRDNAFDLSICPSCGAMMNDSVRRDALPKISISKPLPPIETKPTTDALPSGKLNQQTINAAAEGASDNDIIDRVCSAPLAPNVVAPRQTTGNLTVKTTSPTLVEFHSDKAKVPEWRLQLQNAVRQRQDRETSSTPETFSAPVAAAAVPNVAASSRRSTKFAVSGANALKIETVQEKKPSNHKNPALTVALERIEKSRQKFYVEEETETSAAPNTQPAPRPASKNFPFYIASKQTTVDAPRREETFADAAKPKLAAGVSRAHESGDLDTNKLPPLTSVVNKPTLQPTAASAKVSTSFAKTAPEQTPEVETQIEEKLEIIPVENKEIVAPEIENAEQKQSEQPDDCAPFALRFNAGFFDLIIGAFLSLLLLSPFILTAAGEASWLSFTGVLAFLATCSIVMFIYLTTTVGFYGRTFGMRMFSLEVVDIEGENYPTLHQAAVSAAVYLLSLAFGGAGFLTAFFNDERRAAHDLASGTIVVREI